MPIGNGSVTRCTLKQFTVDKDSGKLVTEASDIRYGGGFVMIKNAAGKVIVYDVVAIARKDGELQAWNLRAAGNQDEPTMIIFND